MRRRFRLDTAETFSTYIYENNRKIAPSSATITVYTPGGAKLVDEAAMSVAVDGLLSYGLTAAHNGAVGVNYMAVVSYARAGATSSVTFFYDVVRHKLTQVVTDDDLIAELPQLKENGWRVSGTAEGGSATTITDAELKRYPDGYFTGGAAYSLDKDETREIADFDPATGTVTTAAFSSPVATGERYALTRAFTTEILRAFEKMEERLLKTGRRPELALDPYDFREAHILLAAAAACKGLATQEGGFWWRMWKEYEKKSTEELESAVLKYDSTGDGLISFGETGERVKTGMTAARR